MRDEPTDYPCACEPPCYVHCVYCGVDCDPLMGLPHAEDCPSATGIYPVRPKDLGPECAHCGERAFGLVCARCNAALSVGDSYMHVPVEGFPPDEAGLVVCVGCAAKEALT